MTVSSVKAAKRSFTEDLMETNTPATTPAKKQVTLMDLSNSQLVFADSADDVRGRNVLDAEHQEVGHVNGLLVDDQEHKVRFIQIAYGGLLGSGERIFLVPIDAIKSVEADHVHIDLTRESVAGAPPYDPDLKDESHYANIYGYYGFVPFWGMGYGYPILPYMPPLTDDALTDDALQEEQSQH